MIKQLDLENNNHFSEFIFKPMYYQVDRSVETNLMYSVHVNIFQKVCNSIWNSALFSIEADIQKKVNK